MGGVAIGYLGAGLISQLQLPTDVLALPPIRVDGRVLGFSVVLATVSAVVFGLGPAFSATRIDLTTALRVAEPAGRRRWQLTARNTLTALQVSLSLAVLTVATIALQTFNEAFGKGPGFRTTQMAKIDVDAGQAGHIGLAAPGFFERVVGEASRVPGVVSAAVASAMPLWSLELAPVNRSGPVVQGEFSLAPLSNVVDEHYFGVMDIPLARGRVFRAADTASAPRVAVVNETLARRYWPTEEAVGKRLTLTSPARRAQGRRVGETEESVEIVGVVRDSVYLYPAEMPQKMLYLPLRQAPRTTMVLLAQTAGPSAAALPGLREAVRRVDATVPVYDAQTIERFYDAIALSVARTILSLVSGIGIVGVAITVIGLYGLCRTPSTGGPRRSASVWLWARPTRASCSCC